MTRELLQRILQSPWWGVLSLVLAAVGLLLALIFYRKGKKERKPRYSVASRTLISGSASGLDQLEIFVKGVLQERVTVSKVAFWNAGGETIRSADIVTKAPIEIALKAGANLLSSSVIYVTEPSIEVTTDAVKVLPAKEDDPGETRLPISFNYLERGQGFVVQIAHNGEALHPVRVTGKIMGALDIERIPSPVNRRRRSAERIERNRALFPVVAVSFCVLLLGGSVYAGFRAAWWICVPLGLLGALFCWAAIDELRGEGIPLRLLERQR
jgi:hypothetical protein